MLSLVHSALDLNPKLYNFAQWLNSPEFVSPGKTQSLGVNTQQQLIQGLPALSVNVPLAFANYNHINGMGCGLKALDDIEKGTIIVKQKTEMGFVSGAGLYDKGGQEEDSEMDELSKKIEINTMKVAA